MMHFRDSSWKYPLIIIENSLKNVLEISLKGRSLGLKIEFQNNIKTQKREGFLKEKQNKRQN